MILLTAWNSFAISQTAFLYIVVCNGNEVEADALIV